MEAAPDEVGKASGVDSMLQRFGVVFGIVIASAVFEAFGQLSTPASVTVGFRPALDAVTASLLHLYLQLRTWDRQPALLAISVAAACFACWGNLRRSARC